MKHWTVAKQDMYALFIPLYKNEARINYLALFSCFYMTNVILSISVPNVP